MIFSLYPYYWLLFSISIFSFLRDKRMSTELLRRTLLDFYQKSYVFIRRVAGESLDYSQGVVDPALMRLAPGPTDPVGSTWKGPVPGLRRGHRGNRMMNSLGWRIYSPTGITAAKACSSKLSTVTCRRQRQTTAAPFCQEQNHDQTQL